MRNDKPNIAHELADGQTNGRNGHDHGADLSHLALSELHQALRETDDNIREAQTHGPLGEQFVRELHTWRAEIFRELERRWTPTPPSSAVRSYSYDVEFPEAAWTGLFATWRDIVAPCTEAALPKLWSALLIAFGLVIGRNAWIENPLQLFANFYVLLIGETARARKSTVLWLASELLRRVENDKLEIVRGFVSSEAIFESLAGHKGNRALGYADEFRYLLSVAKRKGTSDILAKMNSLYECPREDQITRKDKTTLVEEPFFSFISATPFEYAQNLLGNDEIAGGVLNRYLVVSGKEQPPKPLVRPPSDHEWQMVAGPLRELSDYYSNHPQRFDLDSSAQKLWCRFYIDWHNSLETMPANEGQLIARIDGHVLKIALVYSLALGESQITAHALAIAIEIAKWLQAAMLKTFKSIGLDPLSKVETDIVEKLAKHGWMYRRDLQRALRVSGTIFARALQSLEANGFVELYDGREQTPYGPYVGGQRKPWVQLIPSDSRHLST